MAAILPFIDPTIETYTIAELRNPDVQKQITAISTLYLPPKTQLECDREAAVKIGMMKAEETTVLNYPKVYQEYESAAGEPSKSHVIPKAYKALYASTAMVDFMTKLALDPKALATYREDPTLSIDSTPGLTPLEANALKLGHQGAIIASMRGKQVYFVSFGNKFLKVNGISLQKDTTAAWLMFGLLLWLMH